jgi:quinol monooxygenase YgiN
MYARLIQLSAKSGQSRDLSKAMQERVLPILKRQAGFVDAIALASDTERDQFVGISIWKSKEDAERYMAGQAPQILQSLKPLIQGEPTFRTFNVEASTSHNVGIARGASLP